MRKSHLNKNPIQPFFITRGTFLHLGASYWPLRMRLPHFTLSNSFCPFQFVYVWDYWWFFLDHRWLIALFDDQGFRFWFYKVCFSVFICIFIFFWCALKKNENITNPKRNLKRSQNRVHSSNKRKTQKLSNGELFCLKYEPKTNPAKPKSL